MEASLELKDVSVSEKYNYFNSNIPILENRIGSKNIQKLRIGVDDFIKHDVCFDSIFSHHFFSKSFECFLKYYLPFMWDSYLANCAAEYLMDQTWPTFMSYSSLQSFFPIISCIVPRLSYHNEATLGCFDRTNQYGKYVMVNMPARKAFLADRLEMEGDVVNLGCGLAYQSLFLLPQANLQRLILNDLNILPLLINVYHASQNPILVHHAEKKLFVHYGRAEELKMQVNSVQKYYAGYLIKYLSQSKLELLQQAVKTRPSV